MRHTEPEYAFSKAELQILRELTKGKQSLPEIRKSLSLKPSLLSHNLKKLRENGLIQTTGQGNRKYACFSETKHASLLRDLLIAYDFMNWENILMGKTIDILFKALSEKEGNLSGFSNATLWRYLKELKARGIIWETQKRYQINPRFSVLIDFIKEYQRYLVNKISKTLSENAVVLWQEDLHLKTSAKLPPQCLDYTIFRFFQNLTSTFTQQT
jgi:DNA-binding MarR family transcriptional regulator